MSRHCWHPIALWLCQCILAGEHSRKSPSRPEWPERKRRHYPLEGDFLFLFFSLLLSLNSRAFLYIQTSEGSDLWVRGVGPLGPTLGVLWLPPMTGKPDSLGVSSRLGRSWYVNEIMVSRPATRKRVTYSSDSNLAKCGRSFRTDIRHRFDSSVWVIVCRLLSTQCPFKSWAKMAWSDLDSRGSSSASSGTRVKYLGSGVRSGSKICGLRSALT